MIPLSCPCFFIKSLPLFKMSQDTATLYEGAGVSGVPLPVSFRAFDSIKLLPLDSVLVIWWRELWTVVKHSRQRLPTR